MNKPFRFAGILASLVLLHACSQASSHATSTSHDHVEEPQATEELQADLLIKEQIAPAEYLKVDGTYRRNFFNQLVLEGDIFNSATLASYKDPVLSVTWYSKTGTEVGTREYPIYELVPASDLTHFKLKTDAPSYVTTVGMRIADATAAE